MIISLDIDDTISAYPNEFAELTLRTYREGGRVIINSSRSEEHESRLITEQQLSDWNIQYDKLYLFRPLDEVEHLCPYPELNWYDKYLWQKIHHCREAGASKHYDDDHKVIDLFKRFATDIEIVPVQRNVNSS